MGTVLQNRSNPGGILTALSAMATPSLTGLRLAVAYCTRAGTTGLVGMLNRVCGPHWEDVNKTIVTSFDFGLTEPKALSLLVDEGFDVRVTGQDGDRINLRPSQAFHPKVYIFDFAEESRALVGSANLTTRGLTVNTELGFVFAADGELNNAWDRMVAESIPVNPLIMKAYKAARPRRPKIKPDDTITHSIALDPQWLRAFGDEVEAGNLTPSDYDSFWVETGSTIDGEPQGQLELPRHANQFFGFHETAYLTDQHEIGAPHLVARGQTFTDRKLTWHGDNRMERISLPTGSQGGYDDYANKILLFQRQPGGFVIELAELDGATGNSWRDASIDAGTIYSLDRVSPWSCGLF